MPISCQLCDSFFFCSKIYFIVSNLIFVHKNDLQIHLTYEVPGCQATFSRVYSYKKSPSPCSQGRNMENERNSTSCLTSLNEIAKGSTNLVKQNVVPENRLDSTGFDTNIYKRDTAFSWQRIPNRK